MADGAMHAGDGGAACQDEEDRAMSVGSHTGSPFMRIVKCACMTNDPENETNLKGKVCTCSGDPCTDGAPVAGSMEFTFGRLFCASNYVAATPEEKDALNDKLACLADLMITESGPDGTLEAGAAFLGQFIDHDLTLDATTELGNSAGDLSQVRNVRTPRLDLDCVYGGGPEVSPHLFDETGGRLLFGRANGEGGLVVGNDLDLPRTRTGRALIGDPRNDENLFVSQTHGRMFVEQHNRFFDKYLEDFGGNCSPREAFHKAYEAAKDDLICLYHTRVIDFLKALVVPSVIDEMLEAACDPNGGRLPPAGCIDWAEAPDMPVEFSGAAYRMGHSLIRERYDLNREGLRTGVNLFETKAFSPVRARDNLDLALFFGEGAQKAGPLDTCLPRAIGVLPAEVVPRPMAPRDRNLAFRNMNRGQITFALKNGKEIATLMGEEPIEPDENLKKAGLENEPPLWYYVLLEAQGCGGQLGPVGGTLVAGTILNLMLRGKSPVLAEIAEGFNPHA